MAETLEKRKLRISMIALKTVEDHLRHLGSVNLADELKNIITKYGEESKEVVPDPVHGIMMEKGQLSERAC